MSTKVGNHNMIDAGMLKYIRQIYMLLRATGTQQQKENLVLGFTSQRTEHISLMQESEALAMIKYLNELQTPDWMAEKAHRMGWQLAPGGNGAKVDMERLNAWCREKSYLGKELNAYTYSELPKLVSQFNEVYKSFLKRVV